MTEKGTDRLKLKKVDDATLNPEFHEPILDWQQSKAEDSSIETGHPKVSSSASNTKTGDAKDKPSYPIVTSDTMTISTLDVMPLKDTLVEVHGGRIGNLKMLVSPWFALMFMLHQ